MRMVSQGAAAMLVAIGVTLPFLEIRFASFPSNQWQCAARQCVPTDFGETGDRWSPMAAELAKNHTVVVPDLRGMGLSSHPAGGYDKWTQASDIRAVLDKLSISIDRADIVGHDIGTMVAYA